MNIVKNEMCDKLNLKDVEISDLRVKIVKLEASGKRLLTTQKQSEEEILMLKNASETGQLKVKEFERKQILLKQTIR